ncbi:MAG: hypothetical protein ACLUUO_15175 [Sellimonas intestinalis]
MNKNRNEQDNRWYEITLKDQSSRIVKGQQSIPAIKLEIGKGKIRLISADHLTRDYETDQRRRSLANTLLFWIWNIPQEIEMHTRRKSFPSGY